MGSELRTLARRAYALTAILLAIRLPAISPYRLLGASLARGPLMVRPFTRASGDMVDEDDGVALLAAVGMFIATWPWYTKIHSKIYGGEGVWCVAVDTV